MTTMTVPVVPAQNLASVSLVRLAPVDLTGQVDEVWTRRETDVARMAFHEYVEAVDEAMREHWMIDTLDAQVDPDIMSEAHDFGITPAAFALRWGSDNGLIAA